MPLNQVKGTTNMFYEYGKTLFENLDGCLFTPPKFRFLDNIAQNILKKVRQTMLHKRFLNGLAADVEVTFNSKQNRYEVIIEWENDNVSYSL